MGCKGGPRKGGWARKGKGPKRRAGLGGEGAKEWDGQEGGSSKGAAREQVGT